MTCNTNPVFPDPITQKHDSASQSEILLMVPTLNEEDAIEDILSEARDAGFANILVVDGFSSDRTREIAERAEATVTMQDFGKGKGCGVRTGMRWFLGGSAGAIIHHRWRWNQHSIISVEYDTAGNVWRSRCCSWFTNREVLEERLYGQIEPGVQPDSILPSRSKIRTAVHRCTDGLLAIRDMLWSGFIQPFVRLDSRLSWRFL